MSGSRGGRSGGGIAVGLLGGSFNPAHEGHLAITGIALRRLALDQVWWLVSPQNPLKTPDEMAPLAERLDKARRMARHPRVTVTGIETALGTRYTVDTLRALRRRYPRIRFVWLMGADNLMQIDRWAHWRRIFETVPVAVFARPTYSLRALAGKAAHRFRRYRVAPSRARGLSSMPPPAWVFFISRLMSISATEIRHRARNESLHSGIKRQISP